MPGKARPPTPRNTRPRYSQRLSTADIQAVLSAFNTDLDVLLEFGKHNGKMP